MKRMISILLAAALLMAVLSLPAGAADAAAEKPLLRGSDIFRYSPEAAEWLDAGLRGWDGDVIGKIAPYLATPLYYLLWPGAKLVQWVRGTFFRVSLRFDLDSAGKVIGNKFSDVNIWAMQSGWSHGHPDPAEFAARYPFAQRLQIMTATGGSAWRDLFLDPDDRSTLTDYNFEPLLAACRNIVAVGMKPMIKTGAVPLKFCAEPIIGTFDVNVLPPDDFNAYYKYIKAIAQALLAEFGLEEMKTWSFGVLTEYENKDWFYVPGADGKPDPEQSKTAYFKLYDYTAAALQDALGRENLTVGAHAMQCAAGLWSPKDFIAHCARGTNYATGETGTQLDFLAASYYDGRPGSFNGKDLANTVGELRGWAEEAGLTGLRFGVDEGRILCGADGKELSARVVAMSY